MNYAVIHVSDVYLGYQMTDTRVEWLCSNEILNEPADGWHLSEDKYQRYDFESVEEAKSAITEFGDESLAVVAVASRPLSPAAIESANWLVSELTRINS